jgi:hypothetical protein
VGKYEEGLAQYHRGSTERAPIAGSPQPQAVGAPAVVVRKIRKVGQNSHSRTAYAKTMRAFKTGKSKAPKPKRARGARARVSVPKYRTFGARRSGSALKWMLKVARKVMRQFGRSSTKGSDTFRRNHGARKGPRAGAKSNWR